MLQQHRISQCHPQYFGVTPYISLRFYPELSLKFTLTGFAGLIPFDLRTIIRSEKLFNKVLDLLGENEKIRLPRKETP
jgi:hypothetical protein